LTKPALIKEGLNSQEKIISEFHRNCHGSGCIVFKNDNSDQETLFRQKLIKIAGQSGTVVPLSGRRTLILLSLANDLELIAHRLSKSLNTEPILCFTANENENILAGLETLP
jgi:hypothetical protein